MAEKVGITFSKKLMHEIPKTDLVSVKVPEMNFATFVVKKENIRESKEDPNKAYTYLDADKDIKMVETEIVPDENGKYTAQDGTKISYNKKEYKVKAAEIKEAFHKAAVEYSEKMSAEKEEEDIPFDR